MASRVNVKFVLILSAALTVVFVGVVGVALWVLSNNGPRLEREGDQLMASGEYEIAKKVYGKAYNKDRSSIVRLDKYIDAIEAWTPATPSEYSGAYAGDLLSAFRTHAIILRTDVESHDRYLNALYQHARWYPQRGAWEGLADAAENALAFFKGDDSEDGDWRHLVRYRGLGRVALMDSSDGLSEGISEKDQDDDQVEKDLNTALEFNPNDTEAAIGLSRFFSITAQKLRLSRRTQEEADLADARANDVIDRYVASYPTDSEALAFRILLSFVQGNPARDKSLRGVELVEAREALLATLEDPLQHLFEILDQKPTKTIDPLHVDRVIALERLITGEVTQSAALIDRVLDDRPNDPTMLSLRATLARGMGDQEQALDFFKRIVEMAMPPVGLEGSILLFQQESAAVSLVDVELSRWSGAADEDREAALVRVVDARSEAGKRVRETDARLIFLDGKIAYAGKNYTLALEKLSAYNDLVGGSDAVALGILSDIYLINNELGSARETTLRLAAIQPQVARHYIRLARVEFSLSNYESAHEYAARAVELDSEDAEAQELLVQISGVTNPEAIAEANPVQAAIIKSRLLALGDSLTAPDVGGAIAMLDTAIDALDSSSAEFASDREMMVIQRIELLAISGDIEAALAQVRVWLPTYPDSERLASLEFRYSVPDTIEGDILAIDAGTDSEHIKLANKYVASVRRGEQAMAEQFIQEALELAPADPTVVELAFGAALARQDFEAAQRLADSAAQANLDRMRGDSYTARLEAAQGDLSAAVTTLGQATRGATVPAGAWRLLGTYQARLGRYSEALTSISEALKRSPNDVNSVITYIQTLVRAGRQAEALREARRNEPLARNSEQFSTIWLSLEAQYGDKEVALARREEIHGRDPANRENSKALVGLYIDLNQLEEARAILDVMRSDDADLTVVILDAMLYKKAGNLAAARESFDSYIASALSSEQGVTYTDYASYASFLIRASFIDDAIAVLEKAQSVQEPGSHVAEAELGRLLYTLNRIEESIDPLRRALETEGVSTRVLLAEAYMRVGDYEASKRTITEFPDDWKDSLDLSLVMIECTDADGERANALRMADELVRRFSESPRPYIERAKLISMDNTHMDDALDDLNAAIARDPAHWLALVMRAEVNSAMGNREAAVQDLRKAVRSNPNLDAQRRVLMVNFIRSGDVKDAKLIADEAIAARPEDLNLLVSMGDLFAGSALWDEATGYFAAAWSRSPSQGTGMRYIASLIRSTRPSLNDADRVLADPICETESTAGMLVLRASLRMKQKEPVLARRDATGAVELAAGDLATTARVLEDLNTVFGTREETAQFVLSLDLTGLPGRARDHFRAVAMLEIDSRFDEGMDLLRDLSSDESDPIIMASARPILISNLLSSEQGEYAEALEMMLVAIEADPDEWTLANNIAFVLSKHLGRPEEALVYAERAREIDPYNPAVLDTLGYVYRRLKRYDEAERSFREAMEGATDRGAWLVSLIHLGQTFADQGKKSEAQTTLDEIDSVLANLGADATNNQDLLDLRQQIEGLK